MLKSVLHSVVFLEELSVEAEIVAKMKPKSKALQWARIYRCEGSLCCGVVDGRGEVVWLPPPPLCDGHCVRPLARTAWACIGRRIPRLPIQALELLLIEYAVLLTRGTQHACSRCSECAVCYDLRAGV